MKGKKGKLCRKHAARYLPPDDRSSLCLHPDCLEALIHSICSRSRRLDKIWKLITDLDMRSQAVSWVITALLAKHEREPAFLMLLTRQFVYFALLNFVNTAMHKEVPLAQSFRLKKRDIKIQHLEDEAAEYIQEQIAAFTVADDRRGIDCSSGRSNTQNNPYSNLLRTQIYEKIADGWGPEWVAYLMDQISMADMMRITGLKVLELKATKAEIADHFKKWWDDIV